MLTNSAAKSLPSVNSTGLCEFALVGGMHLNILQYVQYLHLWHSDINLMLYKPHTMVTQPTSAITTLLRQERLWMQ